MIENKRFMVDDAGTLIDMQTRDMFDIVEEVCPLLNEQHETIQRLKKNIDELLSVDIEKELLEENEHLKKQMQRLYNYFVDWHGDIMGANQFSEMWDYVKEDEDWEL